MTAVTLVGATLLPLRRPVRWDTAAAPASGMISLYLPQFGDRGGHNQAISFPDQSSSSTDSGRIDPTTFGNPLALL
ncbi:unnamed protein product [Cuscuta campestris]|uniref:Uncharacterized protein n=1 Tax=Cuscuta campestris TaxID=132261 RepID=A0A484LW13_9ASTE|nr:unnamed protein product [Cuscuta campestris]